MKLNVSDDEKRRTEKRFGVDCFYRRGFKMIKSDGRHLILVCTRAPKGEDKGTPPLNKYVMQIHQLPVKSESFKPVEGLTNSDMIQPYKEEGLARFFEMNDIYNRSTPIFNIINPET
jgi:hypothetical protein